MVSVGSTPTATFARSLEGVTEVRAGVFVFQDLVMAGLGVCRVEDIAVSVLATVIGHQREKGWIITDGGWMAMSRDRGTARQATDQGYGLVCDESGRVIGDLVVSDANQEHGIVSRRGGGELDLTPFPVGTRLQNPSQPRLRHGGAARCLPRREGRPRGYRPVAALRRLVEETQAP